MTGLIGTVLIGTVLIGMLIGGMLIGETPPCLRIASQVAVERAFAWISIDIAPRLTR